MKRFLLYSSVFLIVFSRPVNCCSQLILYAEYFVNTDPGVGSGTPIIVVPGIKIKTTFSVKANSLQPGFNQLFVRTEDTSGNWSIASQRTFYVDNNLHLSIPSLTAAEYFTDTDPGAGNGIAINIQQGVLINKIINLNTKTLPSGFHQLYIRVKDQYNNWSIAEQRTFYIDKTLHNTEPLTASEYFIDKDPGTGKGTGININSKDTVVSIFNVNTRGLSTGFHQLYIRAKDTTGKWSIAEQRTFYIDNTLHNTEPITASEYFIDEDPGVGKATAINIHSNDTIASIFNVSTRGLAMGFHQLFIRAKDTTGKWSIAEQRTFYLNKDIQLVPSPIIAAEYYINKDAGVGRNTAIVVNRSDSVDTSYTYAASNLAFGNYTMNLRVKDSSGKWSIVESRPFTVKDTATLLSGFAAVKSSQNAEAYSNTLKVNGSTTINIYPTPAKDRLNITLQSEHNYSAAILLSDMYGTPVITWRENIQTGSNNFSLDILNVASGTYFLNVQGINTWFTQKVIIIK